MESPFYFTMPLKARLELIRYISQQYNYDMVMKIVISPLKSK